MAHNRHLRFLITSALLVGPVAGCGDADPEPNTTAPVEAPVHPDPEMEPEVNTQFDEDLPNEENEELDEPADTTETLDEESPAGLSQRPPGSRPHPNI